ncbi:ion channel [Paraglaciecola psychrophila]|uniref:Potassium channel domain-containing protein n=1 Tax=Paraglaciecola psychrophila 170 TaxID=1129794 RepID=K7AHH1_9ALTE|nr:ion channel [Paraglaciecola psychrophila]AGH47592.1 hypothetical protein C427_5495 [Paraglaciecola psychrophila 170]GAC40048.1 hypothetical protein GPSY_4445 [Paraglaciecola psychrophila 170]
MIEKDIQPDKFCSIPAVMWGVITLLTTLGYGDFIPITPWGNFLVAALPADILASSFSETAHQKRENFKLKSSKL